MVRASTDRGRRHRQAPPLRRGILSRRHWTKRAAVILAAGTLAVIILALVIPGIESKKDGMHPRQPGPAALPATPGSYLGVYAPEAPNSYAGVTAFTRATGVRPRLVVYYSGWWEPFRTSFATTAAKHGAVPLVQIDPTDISLSAIASGRYDAYLTSYAQAVRAYRDPVILSFGHEMNGAWYSWGYRSASPTAFVAAWRHIVTLFRAAGTQNVTWLWTINIIKTQHGQISSPAPWWPGGSYVNWVGIDGYYLKSSWRFVPIFGPTIVAVRELTGDPILVAETSAAPNADQPEKIPDLFAGIRTYGLLGFVWFDAVASHDYPINGQSVIDFRINGQAAIAAFRKSAKTYSRPAS